MGKLSSQPSTSSRSHNEGAVFKFKKKSRGSSTSKETTSDQKATKEVEKQKEKVKKKQKSPEYIEEDSSSSEEETFESSAEDEMDDVDASKESEDDEEESESGSEEEEEQAMDLSEKKKKKGEDDKYLNWVDEAMVYTASDYEERDGKRAQAKPDFSFKSMMKRDLEPAVRALNKKKVAYEKQTGEAFIYPMSPLVSEYLNVLSYLTYKKTKLQKKKEEGKGDEKALSRSLHALSTMQAGLCKKIRPIFPDLDVVYSKSEYEDKYLTESKKRKKEKPRSEKSSKKAKVDEGSIADESGDEGSDKSGDEGEEEAVDLYPQRGKVLNEETFNRKRVVENLKGEDKKHFYFQLNKRWSIYSDETTVHRGIEEKYDVITICRQPLPEAVNRARMNNKTLKPYKMSFPITQGEILTFFVPRT